MTGKVNIHLFSISCLNQAMQMQTGPGLAHRSQDRLAGDSIQAPMLTPSAACLRKSDTGALQHAPCSSHFREREQRWSRPFSGEDWNTGVCILGRLFPVFPLPSSHTTSVSSALFQIPQPGHSEVQGLRRAVSRVRPSRAPGRCRKEK